LRWWKVETRDEDLVPRGGAMPRWWLGELERGEFAAVIAGSGGWESVRWG